MSRIDVKRLMRDIQRDPDLLEELRTIGPNFEGVREWTGTKGYDVTAAEIQDLLDSDRELSDDELEDAAGGDGWPTG
jgi:predicted ribosomally synthesized peptide with nif11-like leader